MWSTVRFTIILSSFVARSTKKGMSQNLTGLSYVAVTEDVVTLCLTDGGNCQGVSTDQPITHTVLYTAHHM